MSNISRFEDLMIWQNSKTFVVNIYNSVKSTNDPGFRDQIQHASLSIINNIAEGSERGSNADFIQFLYYSKASCGEVRSMLYIAKEIGIIDDGSADGLIKESRALSDSIANFISYLKKSKIKNPPLSGL